MPVTFEAFKQKKMFENLDWLRGVSILLVLFHHTPGNSLPEGVLRVFQANGRFGVSVFFAISGFLISTLLIREEERKGRISLGRFYARRSLRLFPLYYAMLFVFAVLVLAFHQFSPEQRRIFVQYLPSHLLYYTNLMPSRTAGPFFFSWSLAVEEQFYFVFSLMMCWMNRRLMLFMLVAGIMAKAVCVGTGIVAIRGGDAVWPRIVFSYEESILVGVLLSFALNTRKGFDRLAFLSHPAAMVATGCGALALLCSVELRNQSAWPSQVFYLLTVLFLAGAVIRGPVPLLANRLMTHTGKISYGIYLQHMLVIIAIKKLVTEQTWVCLALSYVGVMIMASLVYRYFEQPILAYKDRYYASDGAKTVTAASPPPQ